MFVTSKFAYLLFSIFVFWTAFLCQTINIFAQEGDSLFSHKTLTFEVFAPFLGQTTISYERFIAPNFSQEVKLGIIGLGFRQGKYDERLDFEQKGVFFRYGVKFYKYVEPRRAWIASSYYRYFKPEIYFGAKQVKLKDADFTQKSQVWFSGILLNYGRRYYLSDFLLFGWEFGLGYSFTKSENELHSKAGLPLTTQFVPINEGLIGPAIAGSRQFPIAISASLHLGYVFR